MENNGEEEDEEYFDAPEGGCSVSVLGFDSDPSCSTSFGIDEGILDNLGYEVWTKYPESVIVRRDRFLKAMGFFADQDFIAREDSYHFYGNGIERNNCWITKDGRRSGSGNSISTEPCSTSSRSLEGNGLDVDDVVEYVLDELVYNQKPVVEYVLGELVYNQKPGQPQMTAVDKGQAASIKELRRISGNFLLDRPLSNGHKWKKKPDSKRHLWKKLGELTCISRGNYDYRTEHNDLELIAGKKMHKVHTHSSGKKYKELSSLYVGQEFLAHDGAILTLKFSIDGQYLASAGEDAVVRLWKVTEEDRSEKIDISDVDSCIYFAFSESSHFASVDVDKECVHSPKANKRSPGSSCAILPLKVFQIGEKPCHEFHGHKDEVLDLSWSSKGYLLSSSVDKTVRLWRVGYDQCLGVFSHNDYVTSVSFNPVDENYFISGSIDGKVRIWEMFGGKVADYTDIREIVSAVCFQPDGKGAIIGTMTGDCRFYQIENNHLELQALINVHGKKKSLGKRITGFQFPPNDPGKVVVTSADYVIRVLCGLEVICKFKGLKSSGSHPIVSFTSDGNHIISSTEDNIWIWNYSNLGKSSSHGKNVRSSENFRSSNVSVALPWCGMEPTPETSSSPMQDPGKCRNSADDSRKLHNLNEYLQRMPQSSPDCFTMSRDFFLEFLPKGSPTWPEERLSNSSPAAASHTMSRSEYRLLKGACHAMSNSPHMWGLVTVAATWDGRIRTYHNFGLPSRG